MTQALTTVQTSRLAELETVIERGLGHFIEVGLALMEIRDSQLYEPHETFKEYCHVRWEISNRHAQRLMSAAVIYENVTSNLLPDLSGTRPSGSHDGQIESVIPLPTSERVLRPLAGLTPAQQQAVYIAAVDSANGKAPTAGAVQAAVSQPLLCRACRVNGVKPKCKECKALNTPPKPFCDKCKAGPVTPGCHACHAIEKAKKDAKAEAKAMRDAQASAEVDAFKNPIPKNRLAAWHDPWFQETLDFLCATVSGIRKKKLSNGMEKRKAHYPFTNAKDVIDGLTFIDNYFEQVIDHLKETRPAGVCPACDGKSCAKCKMKGLVPRDVYKAIKESAK